MTDRDDVNIEDDTRDDGGIRAGIEAGLTGETLQTFHELTGGQSDIQQFRDRLATILTRYERHVIAFAASPKKERRRQLEQIEARALGVAKALVKASEHVHGSLNHHGDKFEAEAWENWSFESGDPLPLKNTLIERVQSSVTELLDAVRAELAELNQTKNEPRQIKQVALRQLIEDLAAFCAHEADMAERHVHADWVRVPAGGRYAFVKGVLDWYDPSAYFSEDALKQQIKRTLKAH